jgi:beta-mannanase
LFIAVLASALTGSANSSASQITLKVIPPPTGAYHSAFPDFGSSEDTVTADRITDFENLVEKKIAWAYFSNNWFEGIQFPATEVRIIHDLGVIPFVRMMPRSNLDRYSADPIYTMQLIINGDFDKDLRGWCQGAREYGGPLMAEFGPEVNGNWFPWSGTYSGGSETKSYGNPSLADGPERFRDAYRHIIDICRSEGAQDITWVFHVNDGSHPQEPWNTMAAYYPGDDYIDWIGVSVYGAGKPGEEWQLFSNLMDTFYPELAAISKNRPLAVLEYGVVDDPKTGDKASWIHDALQSVKSGRYPRIEAMSYWHENWLNDDGSVSNMRLDSSPTALDAYREEIADPFFVTQAYTAGAFQTSTIQTTTIPVSTSGPATHAQTTSEETAVGTVQPSKQLLDINLTLIVAAVAAVAALTLIALGVTRIKKRARS